ncbi:hypothetical protein BD408DRAFT_437868 [Parasitella parasitica]|nr:hypothetical protein BD408DRAFT_437868 [Parasitella parasitica]
MKKKHLTGHSSLTYLHKSSQNWKSLPLLSLGASSNNSAKTPSSSMREANGQDREPLIVSSYPSSRSRGWMPPRPSMPSKREPIVCVRQEEPALKSLQTSNTSLNRERLAVYSFATGKELDQDAKDLATRTIKLPENMQYLRDNKQEDRDLAFSTEVVEKIYQGRYEETILKQATSRSYGGFKSRGNHRSSHRGGFSRGGRSNFFGKGRGRGKPPHQLQQYPTIRQTPQTSEIIDVDHRHALHCTGRWVSSRRTSTALPPQLEEKDHNTQIALVYYQPRIPDTVPILLCTMETEAPITEPGAGSCGEKIFGLKSNRTGTGPRRPFSLNSIHDPGNQQDSTHILDCRRINKHIQVQHFKIEGIPAALRQLIEQD